MYWKIMFFFILEKYWNFTFEKLWGAWLSYRRYISYNLPVRHRINFKIATTAFKVLHHQQPLYLAQILPRYTPSRSLWSSSSITISAPLRKTSMATSKSFSSTASQVWNKLPTHISSALTCLFSEGISGTICSWMHTRVSMHQPSNLIVSHRPPNAFQPSAYD